MVLSWMAIFSSENVLRLACIIIGDVLGVLTEMTLIALFLGNWPSHLHVVLSQKSSMTESKKNKNNWQINNVVSCKFTSSWSNNVRVAVLGLKCVFYAMSLEGLKGQKNNNRYYVGKLFFWIWKIQLSFTMSMKHKLIYSPTKEEEEIFTDINILKEGFLQCRVTGNLSQNEIKYTRFQSRFLSGSKRSTSFK